MEIKGLYNLFYNCSLINTSCDLKFKVIGLSTRWTQIMQDPIIKILFQNSSPTMMISISTILISALCVGTWCCAYIFNR